MFHPFFHNGNFKLKINQASILTKFVYVILIDILLTGLYQFFFNVIADVNNKVEDNNWLLLIKYLKLLYLFTGLKDLRNIVHLWYIDCIFMGKFAIINLESFIIFHMILNKTDNNIFQG